MGTLIQQLRINDVLTWIALAGLLWRLGQIVAILRTGLNQHQVMWWYTTKKAGVPLDAEPRAVQAKLEERLEAKAKAARKS